MGIQTALQGELRDMMENNPLGVAIMQDVYNDEGSVNARQVFANDSLIRLFGPSTVDELVDRPPLNWSIPYSRIEGDQRCLSSDTNQQKLLSICAR